MCPKPQRDDYNFREGWQSARQSKSNHRGSARRTCCFRKPKVQFQGTSTMTNHEFVDGSTPGMGHSHVLLIPRVREVQREGAWVTFQFLYHSRGQWTAFWSVAVWLAPCISLAVLLSIPPLLMWVWAVNFKAAWQEYCKEHVSGIIHLFF